MAAHLNPPLHNHRQDLIDDCGRACAQMIIGYVREGAGATGAPPLVQQLELAAKEANTIPGWATDPLELVTMINDGVTPHTTRRWRVATFIAGPKPTSAETTTAELDLLAQVKRTLDLQYPAIVSVESSDHWVVVTGYEEDPATNMIKVLFQADPLAVGAFGQAFQHGFTDQCPAAAGQALCCLQSVETIDFVSDDPYEQFVIDAAPYSRQAIAIVLDENGGVTPPRPPVNIHVAGAWRRMLMRFVRLPFIRRRRPPLPPPPPAEVSIRRAAEHWHTTVLSAIHGVNVRQRKLVEHLDPAQAYVRYVRFLDDSRPPYVLVGAPASRTHGVLAVLSAEGKLLSLSVTDRRLVDCLEIDVVNRFDPQLHLVCVPRYGRFQPFKRTVTVDGVRLERLSDGYLLRPAAARD
jgi:hypothetical protein